jgi:trehalose 6-phosphate synthase/phosphatase
MLNKEGIKRLVIIAYRLPFKFLKTKDSYKAVQNSGGLVSAMLALSENFKRNNTTDNEKIVWIGTGENLPENVPKDKLENENFEIVPVKLPSKLNDHYYGGFCNDLIWPLFHYFSSDGVIKDSYFEAYVEANSLFCTEVIKHIRPGDFVWIHDYQLLLLPELIREKIPEAFLGFFLHIPFPSSEIFRLLPRPWRIAIINGMLGADLVGFHTHDYSQHFIKSVKRVTGYECRQNIIFTPHKVVKADAFPIGIDYDRYHNSSISKGVLNEKQRITESLAGQKLIFSVDRLDYTKGLISRLKGFEKFLEKYPEWKSRVVFNMVVVPSRDSIDKYKDMKKEIEAVVGRINGSYSTLEWRPVIYQYKSLSFNELVALYDVSDVGLITPLRDGMNLVAKEYIACQSENTGVLILSEMAGAAAELNEALIINPGDINEMGNAINTALGMSSEEKENRVSRMQKRLAAYNVFTWAQDFFDQTFYIKKQQKIMKVKFVNEDIARKIHEEYQKSNHRILFLDYDGTLVAFTKYPEMALIDKVTLDIVRKLADDPKNQTVIISGRGKEFLERQFIGIPVTLVAEHGYFIQKNGIDWVSTMNTDIQWKETVKPILLEYVNRCNGSFIEEKTGSLAWHYRNAESDFAELRLNELRDDLAEIIRYKTDFVILEGNKVLEVKSGKYDKGIAAAELISREHYDFILAAGDDNTDEFLFEALPDFAFSIRVGLRPSFAKYNIKDTESLLNFLSYLTDQKEISS